MDLLDRPAPVLPLDPHRRARRRARLLRLSQAQVSDVQRSAAAQAAVRALGAPRRTPRAPWER